MDRRFEAAAEAPEHERVGPGVRECVIGGGGAGNPEIRRDDRKRLHVFEHAADVAVDVADPDREVAGHRIDQVGASAEQRVVVRRLLSGGSGEHAVGNRPRESQIEVIRCDAGIG